MFYVDFNIIQNRVYLGGVGGVPFPSLSMHHLLHK
jgi:hypothetical protein